MQIWSALAKACPSRLDQFTFFQKALAVVENPLDRVDFLVDYAEVCFALCRCQSIGTITDLALMPMAVAVYEQPVAQRRRRSSVHGSGPPPRWYYHQDLLDRLFVTAILLRLDVLLTTHTRS